MLELVATFGLTVLAFGIPILLYSGFKKPKLERIGLAMMYAGTALAMGSFLIFMWGEAIRLSSI